jgi:hypothetical protein
VVDEHRVQRAKSLFSGSIGYYEAARSLYEVTGERHWPAFFVLLSYAAELSAKSFIMHKAQGASEKTLLDLGHRLSDGLKSAMTAGYVPPNYTTAEMFAMLNEHHVNHHARYLFGPAVVMKPHTIMLAAMAHHLTTIGEQMNFPIALAVPIRDGHSF